MKYLTSHFRFANNFTHWMTTHMNLIDWWLWMPNTLHTHIWKQYLLLTWWWYSSIKGWYSSSKGWYIARGWYSSLVRGWHTTGGNLLLGTITLNYISYKFTSTNLSCCHALFILHRVPRVVLETLHTLSNHRSWPQCHQLWRRVVVNWTMVVSWKCNRS